jgi:perosamine synthetase
MTCINIPNIEQIIRFNGLIPIVVDVDFNTMSPNLEAIKALKSEKTKAILFSFIYGVPFEIDEIA